jgi:anti-sigma regulatory factor (Ser/Thr protein kinase)
MARELSSISGMARGSTRRGPDPVPIRLVDRAPTGPGTSLSRPRWSYQALLPSDPRSASFAREFVCNRLAEHDLEHLVHDVRLVASELATNAVLRARRPFIVSLRGGDRRVLLSVRDSSRSGLARPCARALDTRGRGLSIVDSLAHEWGIQHGPGGTGVWAAFEVRREHHGRSADGARRLRLSG